MYFRRSYFDKDRVRHTNRYLPGAADEAGSDADFIFAVGLRKSDFAVFDFKAYVWIFTQRKLAVY
jgi:hypothetical protein